MIVLKEIDVLAVSAKTASKHRLHCVSENGQTVFESAAVSI